MKLYYTENSPSCYTCILKDVPDGAWFVCTGNSNTPGLSRGRVYQRYGGNGLRDPAQAHNPVRNYQRGNPEFFGRHGYWDYALSNEEVIILDYEPYKNTLSLDEIDSLL
jgi:hypothetical protein